MGTWINILFDAERDYPAAENELDKAIEADFKNRKFPPMLTVSRLISLDKLPNETRLKLSDFLCGKHRGKRGTKVDADVTRQV